MPMNWKHFLNRYGALCALILVGSALGVTYFATAEKPEPAPIEDQQTMDATSAPAATPKTESPIVTPLPRPVEEEDNSQETGLFGARVQLIRPAEGEIQRPYSADKLIYQPTLKEFSTHMGIDISCLDGQQIVSAAAGEVVSIYTDPLWGNCIEIRHTDEITTLYAALATCQVEEGQKVEAGTPIATAGNSAKCELSQREHLHFEVHKDGEAVDPADYMGS